MRNAVMDITHWGNISPRAVPRTGEDGPARTVWHYVWRMTGCHQIVICMLAVLVALLNLAPLELQRRLIDNAIAKGDMELLYWLGGLYVAVFLGLRAAKFSLRLYQGWLSESAVRYTRKHLTGIYCDRDREKDEHRPGEAVSVINSETDKLGGFVGGEISQAVSNASMGIGIVVYMMVVEPKVALAALAVLVPQAMVAPVMQQYLNRLTEERLSYLREFGQLVANDDACKGERTMGWLDRIYSNQISFYLWKFLMKGLLNLLNGLGPIVVLTFGGYMAVQGETTVGVLVAFISGFDKLSSPVRELIGFYRRAEQARVQHDMIAAWMCDDPSWLERGQEAEDKAREEAERAEVKSA